jgi:hypothetical protein
MKEVKNLLFVRNNIDLINEYKKQLENNMLFKLIIMDFCSESEEDLSEYVMAAAMIRKWE